MPSSDDEQGLEAIVSSWTRLGPCRVNELLQYSNVQYSTPPHSRKVDNQLIMPKQSDFEAEVNS